MATVSGTFYRHASISYPALRGATLEADGSGRRLSRSLPREAQKSVIVEAYRHLVDDVEGMRGDLVASRHFVTCEVNVTKLLDLRNPASVLALGLTLADLNGPHGPCQLMDRPRTNSASTVSSPPPPRVWAKR